MDGQMTGQAHQEDTAGQARQTACRTGRDACPTKTHLFNTHFFIPHLPFSIPPKFQKKLKKFLPGYCLF